MTQPAAAAPALDPLLGAPGGLHALGAIVLVLLLVAGLAWLVHRGTLRLPGSLKRQPVTIESATPLGERRSLVVVTVEGRRLLLGITPTQIALVTELGQAPRHFSESLDHHLREPGATS